MLVNEIWPPVEPGQLIGENGEITEPEPEPRSREFLIALACMDSAKRKAASIDPSAVGVLTHLMAPEWDFSINKLQALGVDVGKVDWLLSLEAVVGTTSPKGPELGQAFSKLKMVHWQAWNEVTGEGGPNETEIDDYLSPTDHVNPID